MIKGLRVGWRWEGVVVVGLVLGGAVVLMLAVLWVVSRM